MKRTVLMLALATLFAVANTAGAEEGKKGKGEGAFAKLDTNNDGKLSEDEFIANKPDKEKAKKRFAKIDADNDGSVTKEELKAAHDNKGGNNKGGDKKKKDKN